MVQRFFRLVIIILLFTANASLIAQNKCGFDRLLDGSPAVKEALIKQALDYKFQQSTANLRRDFLYTYDTTYEIKVVYHVLYNNSLEDVPDSSLLSQLEVLSEDFARTNRDTANTRDIFKNVTGSLKIKFVLADKDPQGNPHSGIIRKFTTITSFSDHQQEDLDLRMKFDALGGSDAWNTDFYLNIWVCDMYPSGAPSFTAGYATPPTNAANWSLQFPKDEQGVVVHYSTVGRYNPRASANGANALGRTTTHELGHYLGLFHTWGLRANTCSEFYDDFIDDTPNTYSQNSGCSFSRNSCGSSVPGDLPDMVENYMDYTFGSCQNTFTKEQVGLMKFNMKKLRPSIYTPIVSKDSTEVISVNGTPSLFSNPGQQLIIGADKYSQTQFKINVFDMLGKQIIHDKIITIDKPIVIFETSNFHYGNYVVKIQNQNTGEEYTYKWVNLEF